MILNVTLNPEFVYIRVCISRAITIDMGDFRLLQRLDCSIIEMTQAREGGHVLWTLGHKASQVEEVVWEAEIKVVALVNLCHILVSKL